MHKPLCPLCGKELQIRGGPEDWKPTFYDPDSGGDPYHANCECGFFFSSGTYEYENFITVLNRRALPENEPLTLEELRQMDGEPVWTTGIGANRNKCYWCLVMVERESVFTVVSDEMTQVGAFCQYGKTWLAYRGKRLEE